MGSSASRQPRDPESFSSEDDRQDYIPSRKSKNPNQDSTAFHRRYELLEDNLSLRRVGKGNFASVYVASPRGDPGQKVAVKVVDLRAQDLDYRAAGFLDKRRQTAFEHEVAIMRRLVDCEHVVGLVDAFMGEGGFAFILLEMCDATIWGVLIQPAELTELFLQRVLCGMLRCIAAVHARGVVHRDIKPDNFLIVGRATTVKLCDFGLSEALPSQEGAEAGLLGVLGTPPFLAPEMIRGNRYGCKVDVWSFGVIVYALLFGELPYIPRRGSAKAMREEILGGCSPSFQRSPSITGRVPPISIEAVSLARTLLQRSPQERPGAEAALHLPFFDCKGHDQQEGGSLKPLVLAACKAGIFSHRRRESARTDLEIHLQAQQQKASDEQVGRMDSARQRSTQFAGDLGKGHIEEGSCGVCGCVSR